VRCVAGGRGHAMEWVKCGIYGYMWPGTSSLETSRGSVGVRTSQRRSRYSSWLVECRMSLVTRAANGRSTGLELEMRGRTILVPLHRRDFLAHVRS